MSYQAKITLPGNISVECVNPETAVRIAELFVIKSAAPVQPATDPEGCSKDQIYVLDNYFGENWVDAVLKVVRRVGPAGIAVDDLRSQVALQKKSRMSRIYHPAANALIEAEVRRAGFQVRGGIALNVIEVSA